MSAQKPVIVMSPEEWQRIEDILDRAMPMSAQDRAALLDRLCADDPALRRHIETLLASYEQAEAEAFLEKSPHLAADHLFLGSAWRQGPETDLTAGQRLGAYVILRPLGQGGMGRVYLAERADGQFQKQVALKLIKRGMDTDEILLRFRYEREILARLEHPNIARLLDAGVSEDGRPYFVMEYVEGEAVDAYCRANGLTIPERLALLETVCEAVHYAHRNLVVHRDLKPGNVLVSGEGTVKLLDFGIAKVLGEQGLEFMTRTGERRLTPQYAAPEQVRGQATTPSTDVYALGVMLYELVTGRRPYRLEGRTLVEVERMICEQVPEKPSTAAQRTLAEAERAAAPEEASQGETTRQRLRRQLRGDLDAIILMALRKEPERRYGSAGELLADLRRYKAGRPVLARADTLRYRAAKFVQRHKAGVAVAGFLFLSLAGLAGAAWRADRSAREAAQEAERADVTLGVIINMLAKVNPEAAQGVTFTARDLIAAGLPEIEALKGQPRVQAAMLNEMGRVSLGAGQVDLADSLHRRALDIQRRELGPNDTDVAESLMRLARVYQERGEGEQAEATYKEAVAVRPDFAQGHGNLGYFYYTQRRYDEAARQLQKVIELMPDDFQAYSILGAIYYAQERWTEARRMWERSVALQPAYWVYSNLATLYYYQEARFADAARTYEKALEINDRDYQVWGHLAAAYYWAPGEQDKAQAAYEKAIRMAEDRLREVNPDDPDVLSRLATYYAETGRRAEALARLERALERSPQEAEVMFRAGYTYERLGDRERALQWIRKALAGGYPRTDIEHEPGLRDLRADPRFRQIPEE